MLRRFTPPLELEQEVLEPVPAERTLYMAVFGRAISDLGAREPSIRRSAKKWFTSKEDGDDYISFKKVLEMFEFTPTIMEEIRKCVQDPKNIRKNIRKRIVPLAKRTKSRIRKHK